MDLELVLQVLQEPEISDGSVGQWVREYLASLSEEDYEKLEAEALDNTRGDRAERIKVLPQLGFSPTEVYEYSKYRLNDPEMRRLIARRALLLKRSAVNESDYTFWELTEMEDRVVGDVPTNEIIEELKDG